MDKSYDGEACVKFMDHLIAFTFNNATKPHRKAILEKFMYGHLFVSWCDLRDFDVDQMRKRLRAAMLGPLTKEEVPPDELISMFSKFKKGILNP